MNTLNINVDNGNAHLQELKVFVEDTKNGNYTHGFAEIERITFGRTEPPSGSENILAHLDDHQVLFFGLSY
jgi:hypothetical protein